MLGGGSILGAGTTPIQSIQYGSITMGVGDVTKASAAFTPVVAANAVVLPLGIIAPTNAGEWDTLCANVSLNSTTTVLASRHAQDGITTLTINFVVVEFVAGILKSNQDFSVSMVGVATNTAVITAVNAARALVIPRGTDYNAVDSTASGANLLKVMAELTLTDTTHVTATRQTGTNTLLVTGTVLEFF